MRGLHRRHSLRHTCHSRLHLNNKTEEHFGVGESQKENKHTERSEPPPRPRKATSQENARLPTEGAVEPKLVRMWAVATSPWSGVTSP